MKYFGGCIFVYNKPKYYGIIKWNVLIKQWSKNGFLSLVNLWLLEGALAFIQGYTN